MVAPIEINSCRGALTHSADREAGASFLHAEALERPGGGDGWRVRSAQVASRDAGCGRSRLRFGVRLDARRRGA
ncbi:hypothetical protein WDZ92_48705, partial [Nostoc sp. NIES-2111]